MKTAQQTLVAFTLFLLAASKSAAATPYSMVSGDYLETFTNIASWTDNFAAPVEATRWGSVPINGSGSIPDGQKTTVATTSFIAITSSAGVQRGVGNIVQLSTGTTDNTNANAIDLYLDFTGRSPGKLSFDWTALTNSTGDRASSLRVYTTTNGTVFTELVGAAVLNKSNNVVASGAITGISLPASFSDCPTARIRFYEYNGTGGSTGARARIGIDNVAVKLPPQIIAQPQSKSVLAGAVATFNVTAAGGLLKYQWRSNSVPILNATNATLVLTNVQPIWSGGSYSVGITNSLGAVTSAPAMLTVVNPISTSFKGHWPSFHPGEARDVATLEGFAYVATTAGLMIFDIGDPTNPVQVGEYNTDAPAVEVAVTNGYAWLATAADQFSYAKVIRIDVRNPGAPNRIAQYSTAALSPRDLALVGDYAYVASTNSVLILNANCNLLQTVTITTSSPQLVSTPGNFACVTGTGWPLLVYDVSNPVTPKPVAKLMAKTMGDGASDFALSGNFNYRFSGGANSFGLEITDISNPLSPQLVGSLQTGVGQYIYDKTLAVSGGFAYCVSYDGTGNGFYVVDVRQPTAPLLLTAQSFLNGQAVEISLLGNHAYVAAGTAGLSIFSLSNPTNPVPAGGYSTAMRLKGVALQGNNSYVLDGNNGFHVLDVTDPAAPRRLKSYVARNNTEAFAQAKRWLYLGVAGGNGTNNPTMEIIDVAEPNVIRRVGIVAHPVSGGNDYRPAVTAIGLDHDLAVLTVGPFGWPDLSPKIIDVSKPTSPVIVGSVSRFGQEVRKVVAQANHAYLADGDPFSPGLRIVDIADAKDPVEVGSYESSTSPDSVCLLGNYCYLSSSNSTEILDLSVLTNPTPIATFSNRISFIQNGRGFGAGANGFKVFDLSNPASPLTIGQYPGVQGEVTVEGRYAFVADIYSGLTILDLGASFATSPAITAQPEHGRTLTGQSTNFFAAVSGSVPIGYQWRFNGTNIPGATQPLLSLTNIQFANAGQYSLAVSNTAGFAISSNGILTVDFPATVTLTSPGSNEVFWPASNIVITASASDMDAPTGWVMRVEFFNGSTLLGVKTNLPPYSDSVFSLTWSNVPAGNYSLKAVATDNEGATNASAPINIVVTTQRAFQLTAANYPVLETNGFVTVTVKRNLDTNTASVTLFTENATAFAAPPGGIGSYYALTNTLTFPSGVVSTNVPITIINDLVNRGDRQFVVRLSNPTGGWQLLESSNAYVTIIDDDPLTNNFADVFIPPGGAAGALRVTLQPTNALGKWRFWWETDWRDSGGTVSNLSVGDYVLEFMPRSGFTAPASSTLTISNAGAFLSRTNYYTNLVGVVPTGGLGVAILPLEVATAVNSTNRGQWRISGGNTNWNDGGTRLPSLPEGAHLVEFKSIPGYETPPRQVMVVAASREVTYEATYLTPAAPIANGPVPLDSYATITNDTTQPGTPYRFAGQIFSDAGLSSGFVVKERTVLTAAHAVFDVGRLTFATNVWWFFQRHRGDHEPLAQQPRGWHVFAGYSAARAADPGPNESTIEARSLDVAALYFFEDAGRGGYGGYLVNATNTEWLASSSLKLMVGYPVEVVPEANRGKMHQVGPFFAAFQKVTNQVYRSDQIVSYGGNSGGPVCVLSTNSAGRAFFTPAGVYLGGSGETIARVIDLDLVDLINRAENSSHGGTNSTGGGVIPISRAAGSLLSHPGYLSVSVGPPAAVRLGAMWRVSPTNYGELGELRFYTNFTSSPLTLAVRSTNFSIQVADLPGFQQPTNRPVVIPESSVEQLPLVYSVIPPWLIYDRSQGLGMTGTLSTAYRVESAALLSESWSTVTNNLVLSAGTNWIINATSSTASNRFYRALWLPE
jgi:hypothetical protein